MIIYKPIEVWSDRKEARMHTDITLEPSEGLALIIQGLNRSYGFELTTENRIYKAHIDMAFQPFENSMPAKPNDVYFNIRRDVKKNTKVMFTLG